MHIEYRNFTPVKHQTTIFAAVWPRSTMDSIRASEAPDTGSIPVEATLKSSNL